MNIDYLSLQERLNMLKNIYTGGTGSIGNMNIIKKQIIELEEILESQYIIPKFESLIPIKLWNGEGLDYTVQFDEYGNERLIGLDGKELESDEN